MKITVQAGKHRRWLAPIEVALTEGALPEGAVRLQGKSGETWGQVILSGGPKLVFVPDALDGGETLEYEAQPAEAPQNVHLHVGSEQVDVEIDGRPFTAYHYTGGVRPYLYPLIGPYGAHVTRHYPMAEVKGERTDHRHHRSVWFTHGDVGGVDNWSEETGHGFTTHERFTRVVSGPVLGELAAEHRWTSASHETLLRETTTLRFYHLPEGERIIDAVLRFEASEGPITFGDTKEGGLVSVRVATSMDASGEGRITNGSGATGEAETWGKRSPWCDYSGPVATAWGRQWVGVSLFDHPSNPRFPTWWHVRNYGLMTANCFGLSHFTSDKTQDGSLPIAAGQVLTWRYRIYLHRGDHAAGRVAERYLDWAHPPVVRVD